MSISGLVGLVIAILAIVAGVRTIRRIGLRRFSLAVGRLGWDVGKVALSGTALVAGALAASAASRSDDDDMDAGLLGPDLMDMNDPANFYDRWDSPLYIAEDLDKKEGGV